MLINIFILCCGVSVCVCLDSWLTLLVCPAQLVSCSSTPLSSSLIRHVDTWLYYGACSCSSNPGNHTCAALLVGSTSYQVTIPLTTITSNRQGCYCPQCNTDRHSSRRRSGNSSSSAILWQQQQQQPCRWSQPQFLTLCDALTSFAPNIGQQCCQQQQQQLPAPADITSSIPSSSSTPFKSNAPLAALQQFCVYKQQQSKGSLHGGW